MEWLELGTSSRISVPLYGHTPWLLLVGVHRPSGPSSGNTGSHTWCRHGMGTCVRERESVCVGKGGCIKFYLHRFGVEEL